MTNNQEPTGFLRGAAFVLALTVAAWIVGLFILGMTQ